MTFVLCVHTANPGVTAEGFPALPTTLTTCRKRRYLNTSLCYLWCASEGVSLYYLLPQVARAVGSAGDPCSDFCVQYLVLKVVGLQLIPWR